MHVNHILLFSAAELWDGLTKTWQMDQSGLQSPSEECVVVKTAFFLTKSLCFHIQNLYVTLPAQIWHYSPCPAVLLSCLNTFPSFTVFVPNWTFAYFPPDSLVFVRVLGNVKPTPSDSHWHPMFCTYSVSMASVISFSAEISLFSDFIFGTGASWSSCFLHQQRATGSQTYLI